MRGLVLIVLALSPILVAQPVANGGFEDGLLGWTVMHAGQEDPDASYTPVANSPHGGAACLVYRKQAGISRNTHVDQTIAVQPGTKYLASAWMRGDGNLRPLLSVEGMNWKRLAGQVAAAVTGWQEVRLCFDAGDREQVRVVWYGGSRGRPYESFPGVAALDDVVVRPATEAEIAELFPQPRTDTRDWFPYTYRWDEIAPAPALDFGIHDAPAGKHGFIGIRDGHLCFPTGQRARFWGVCVCGKSAFPTHEQADIVAARLAKCGVNLVRLHALEGVLLDSQAQSSRIFDPEMLERVDYLAAALLKRGIYLFMDWRTNFRVLKNDGLAPHHLYLWSLLDERFVALNQDYGRLLFQHENPYTGRRYVDEPGLVAVEIINETDVFGAFEGKKSENADTELLRAALGERWNRWLLEQYGDRNGVAKAWTDARGQCGLRPDEDPAQGNVELPLPAYNTGTWDRDNTTPTGLARTSDALRFLYTLQTDYFLRMRRFLGDLGVRVPISGTNWKMHIRPNARSNAQLDFTENHAYWDHAMPWPPSLKGYTASRQKPMVRTNPVLGDSGIIDQLGAGAVPGKPFLVTEWNFDNPNEYRCEGPLWMAAYGSLQDWDAVICYCFYGGWGRSWDQVGEYDERGMYLGSEETFNDPALLALFPAASALFVRGDVQPARHEVHIGYSATDAFASQGSWGNELGHLRFLSYRHRVRQAYFDTAYAGKAAAVVASGLSATGDYSAAAHAVLGANTPLLDAHGSQRDWNALARAMLPGSPVADGDQGTLFPLSLNAVPADATLLWPEQGGCSGLLDDRRLLLPPSAQLARRDPLWFRQAFAQASARWGLGEETDPADQIVADTGELAWQLRDGRMTIQTPRAVGVTGFVGGQRIGLGEITVEAVTPFASILAVSLDGQPLATSSRILLTAVARAENTDQVWSDNRTRVEGTGRGRAPVLAEPVVGSVHFSHPPTRVRVLDIAGVPGMVVPFHAPGSIRLAAPCRSLHYLVER